MSWAPQTQLRTMLLLDLQVMYDLSTDQTAWVDHMASTAEIDGLARGLTGVRHRYDTGEVLAHATRLVNEMLYDSPMLDSDGDVHPAVVAAALLNPGGYLAREMFHLDIDSDIYTIRRIHLVGRHEEPRCYWVPQVLVEWVKAGVCRLPLNPESRQLLG